MKNNKNINMRERMKVLAGITQDDILSTLYIPKSQEAIQFKHIPNWFDKLRYKICGFKLNVIRETPKVHEQRVLNKSAITIEV